MNRYQLADQLRSDCGISGAESTTVNPSGEWRDVVNWVDRAWRDIQMRHNDWLWMRKPFSFVTVAEQAEYAPSDAPLSLTDFARWVPGAFRIYKDSIDHEIFLNQWHDYDQFRDTWMHGTLRSSYSQPTEIAISPTKSLILALPPADTSYTISGWYYKTPQAMTLDTDEPDMPERFHEAIVYKAMVYAGVKENAVELIDFGQQEFKSLLTKLEIDQLPSLTFDRR